LISRAVDQRQWRQGVSKGGGLGDGSARQARSVMGRSVSLHHKTNLHQVEVKPFVSNEKSISANGSQSLQLKIQMNARKKDFPYQLDRRHPGTDMVNPLKLFPDRHRFGNRPAGVFPRSV
jgi:hypothetical protein